MRGGCVCVVGDTTGCGSVGVNGLGVFGGGFNAGGRGCSELKN